MQRFDAQLQERIKKEENKFLQKQREKAEAYVKELQIIRAEKIMTHFLNQHCVIMAP